MRFAVIPVSLLVLALESPLAAQASGAAPVTAIDARVAGDDKRTRFVLDLSGPIEVSAFTLADPYRLILDFAELKFNLPPAAGRTGRGLVSAFRYGVFAPGKARIVIDADGPVEVDRTFII
jgi:N-acetylmuramoyl-L-alanine amidase